MYIYYIWKLGFTLKFTFSEDASHADILISFAKGHERESVETSFRLRHTFLSRPRP